MVACSFGMGTIIQQVHDACFGGPMTGVTVADGGRSLIIDGRPLPKPGEPFNVEVGATPAKIYCVLEELEAPESVVAQVRNTPLDGEQVEATWGDFVARWSYHTDRGLDMIIEMTE